MRNFGKSSRERRLAIRWVAFGLLAAGFNIAPTVSGASGAQGGHGHETSTADRAARAAALDHSFHVLEAGEKRAVADTYELSAITREFGQEPEKLFAWVRDHTSWAPYRGTLRGSAGVLMDRTGNSLDRALLLADLIRSTDVAVRLAHGPLSLSEAKNAYTRLGPVHAWPSAAARENEIATAAKIKFDRIAEDLTQRVAEQSRALAGAIGQTGAAPVDGAQPNAGTLDALRDHWWVQYSDRGNWIDLDPLFPDTRPGETPSKAADTVVLEPGNARPTLDAKLRHEVEVRVIAEQWKDGHLKESVVLTQTLLPAELSGRRISLTHYPLDWPGNAPSKDPAEVVRQTKAAILAQHEWVPVLTIGEDPIIVQSSVSDQGDINPKPLLDATARAGKKAATNVNLAGKIFGDDPEGQPSGIFTAEWIEYEIRCPGEPPRKIRRDVFDLIGPAARAHGVTEAPAIEETARANAGFALLGTTDVLVLSCQLSAEFVQHTLVSNLLDNRLGLRDLLDRAQSKSESAKPEAKPLKLLSACLYGMAFMRGHLSRFRNDVYVASPNVLAFHNYRRLGEGDTTVLCQGFDIVANDIAVRPQSKQSAFAVRLEQGVLDTNAEAMFLFATGKRENVAELFGADSARGESWVTLRRGSGAPISDVHLTDNSRARIDEALAAGLIVIAPRNPVKLGDDAACGWWVIDPKTGQTLGMGEEGWGTTLVESAQHFAAFINENREFICTAGKVYEIVGVVAAVIGQNEMAEAAGTVATGMAAICGEP
jgi:hypothetical protein